jgi:hypothetical protein
LIVLAILLGSGCRCPCEKADGTPLFDGKSLAGWRTFLVDPAVPATDVWSVREGLLICKGEPLGYMYTDQDYTSFRLLVEWRWAPGTTPGNNGVLMRINGEPRGVPRCIEAQLKSGDAGDLYGFFGMKISGDPARMKREANHALVGDMVGVTKMASLEAAPGEWNVIEIEADGPHITVWVNGQKANEAQDCDVLAGPIGLQSEGGEIHFRRVILTPKD